MRLLGLLLPGHQLLHNGTEVEGGGLLHGRVIHQRLHVFAEQVLDWFVDPLFGLKNLRAVADLVKGLEGVHADVEHQREFLLHVGRVVVLAGFEVEFPLLVANRPDRGLVVVDEIVSSAFFSLAKPVVEVVDAVNVLLTLDLHLLGDIGLAGHRREGGENIHVGLDAIEFPASRNMAGPADHHRNAYTALKGCHLFTAEGCGAAVELGTVLGAVVGGVDDYGVVHDAELLQAVEQLADLHVMFDHTAAVGVVLGGNVSGEILVLVTEAGVHVHPAWVEPDEEGLVRLLRAFDEVEAGLDELLVHSLHPLLSKLTGILDLLLANFAEAVVDRGIVRIGGPSVEHAAGTEFLKVFGILWVVALLELLLSVQVIEVTEELVEAMHRRQVLVAVAKVILAELAGRIAKRLEHLGKSRRFRLEPKFRARTPDRSHAAADRILPGDQRRPPGGAGGLGVMIGKQRSLLGNSVDVGSPVAHGAMTVGTDIFPAHIIREDDEDVGFVLCDGRCN